MQAPYLMYEAIHSHKSEKRTRHWLRHEHTTTTNLDLSSKSFNSATWNEQVKLSNHNHTRRRACTTWPHSPKLKSLLLHVHVSGNWDTARHLSRAWFFVEQVWSEGFGAKHRAFVHNSKIFAGSQFEFFVGKMKCKIFTLATGNLSRVC